MTDALASRKAEKAKKPVFTRQDITKKKRLTKSGWRKPKGLQSKMRLSKGGRKGTPSPGWGSPAAAKGLVTGGLKPVVVFRASDVAALQKGEGAVVSSGVGMKKACEILTAAKEKNITVLNIKDADAYLADAKKALEERKKKTKRKVLATSKEDKKPSKDGGKKKDASDKDEKKTEGAKGTNSTSGDSGTDSEDRKKQEKTEQDKVLTKKA